MQRALASAIGLPRSSTSASWMLGLLMPEEQRRNFTMPPMSSTAGETFPAAAGLRRQFSPARPPGLGGGHCALGLVDAVAHESCGGSPVQGYKGQSPGEPTVLVGSQRFRSRAFVGVEKSSRLDQFAALCYVVQAARDVIQSLPDPHEIQVEGRPRAV